MSIIRKTIALAKTKGVKLNAYVDDINTFTTDEQFDIIYSTGTVQYLFEEKMWKSGELFTFFSDWKVESINEVIFEDNSGGVPHYHCMDTILCRRVV